MSLLKSRKDSKQQINATLAWLLKNAFVTSEDLISFTNTDPTFAYELLYGSIKVLGLAEHDCRIAINFALLNFLKIVDINETDYSKIFDQELNKVAQRIMVERQIFTVVAYVNINSEVLNQIEQIKIHDSIIEFIGEAIFTELDFTKFYKDIRKQSKLSGHNYEGMVGAQILSDSRLVYPIKIRQLAYSDQGAVENTNAALTLLFATLNIGSTSDLITRISSSWQPIGSILLPYVFVVFDQDNNYLSWASHSYPHLFNSAIFPLRPYKATTEDLENLQSILEYINSSHGLSKLLVTILKLYQQSISQNTPSIAFLELWQVLETLCLDSPDRKRGVSKRVLHFLGYINKNKIAEGLIEIIENKRHDLVHANEGFPNEMRSLVFICKRYVEMAILKFVDLFSEIKSEAEWDEYLNHISMDKKILSIRRKVISIIDPKDT